MSESVIRDIAGYSLVGLAILSVFLIALSYRVFWNIKEKYKLDDRYFSSLGALYVIPCIWMKDFPKNAKKEVIVKFIPLHFSGLIVIFALSAVAAVYHYSSWW